MWAENICIIIKWIDNYFMFNQSVNKPKYGGMEPFIGDLYRSLLLLNGYYESKVFSVKSHSWIALISAVIRFRLIPNSILVEFPSHYLCFQSPCGDQYV